MTTKTPFRVLVVGAGPAGLSTALAIAQQHRRLSFPSPIHVTVLEVRGSVQTLGGAVNLTPLALRYLDDLGAGERLRPKGSPVSSIEIVSHRTGKLLAQLWPGADALRVQRQTLVESLLETLKEVNGEAGLVRIEYGARISSIEQHGDESAMDGKLGGVRVTWDKVGANRGNLSLPATEVTEADLVVGCDGLHSQVRTLAVDPERQKVYSGRCAAYGYVKATEEDASRWLRSDGEPVLTDTTLIQDVGDSLLVTFFKRPEEREQIYVAAVTRVPEPKEGAIREGWALLGADKAGLKRDIASKFQTGSLSCVQDILRKCDEWFFFPIYMLSAEGLWSKGRVQLIGDAAHAMPPQGESTGIAIEDGVLLARVLSRCETRSVPQMLTDYDSLRRQDIAAAYKATMRRWQHKAPESWFGRLVMDWLTWAVITYTNLFSDQFARDVRNLPLPE